MRIVIRHCPVELRLLEIEKTIEKTTGLLTVPCGVDSTGLRVYYLEGGTDEAVDQLNALEGWNVEKTKAPVEETV
jgi:hypothetical protein